MLTRNFRKRRPIARWMAAGTVALVLAGGAVGARAETLTDALISAYKSSNLLDQNRALLRAGDEDIAAAVAAMRPSLSYSANASTTFNSVTGNSNTATLSLVADMVLFNFGASELNVAVAREASEAARAGLVNVEQAVLFGAVQAYVGMISASKTVALRENNVQVNEQQLKATKDRFDLGEVTRTDVALAEAALALSKANLAAAQGDLAVARESYKLAVGHYPGQLAALPAAPRTASSVADAVAVATRSHPSVRQVQHNVKIADLGVELAGAQMRPTLSGRLTVGAGQQNGVAGTSESLSLSFGGPIYQGGKLAAFYRKAQARAEASRAELLQTSATVAKGVGQAYSQLVVAGAQLSAIDQQISASQVAYDGIREEAQLGSRTTLDVLNAEQNLLSAQSNRIVAENGQYLATFGLLQAMGLLTVQHLGLGVPSYDPDAYRNTVASAPTTLVSPQGQKLDRVLKALGKK